MARRSWRMFSDSSWVINSDCSLELLISYELCERFRANRADLEWRLFDCVCRFGGWSSILNRCQIPERVQDERDDVFIFLRSLPVFHSPESSISETATPSLEEEKLTFDSCPNYFPRYSSSASTNRSWEYLPCTIVERSWELCNRSIVWVLPRVEHLAILQRRWSAKS